MCLSVWLSEVLKDKISMGRCSLKFYVQHGMIAKILILGGIDMGNSENRLQKRVEDSQIE